MRYPYENLGPDLFQELVQSLLLKMNPDIVCYPVGQADGGRDAVFADSGDGDFVVYQVKFSRDPAKIKDTFSWLKQAITGELEKIQELYKRGAKKYYLITNVPGTAKRDTGTMDKVSELFESLDIEGAQCLWRDDIDRRLDSYSDLKWSYPTLISGMDVLKALVEGGLNENKDRRTLAIRAFLRTEFKKDEKVRFKQVDLQNDLLKLFIDVPITPIESESDSSASYKEALIHKVYSLTENDHEGDDDIDIDVLSRMHSRRSAVGTAQFLLNKIVGNREPIIVLEGGPGQGKSTLTQYVSQVHRARLLKEDGFLKGVPENHLKQPVKLPFRIDLRDLSTWLEKINPFRNTGQDGHIENWSP